MGGASKKPTVEYSPPKQHYIPDYFLEPLLASSPRATGWGVAGARAQRRACPQATLHFQPISFFPVGSVRFLH